MSRNVEDFAKYFIKHKYDYPRNTFDGNMKLQKMLYFSQLIHLAMKGKKLFEEPMHAFENGTVIEPIRKKYLNKTSTFVREAQGSTFDFTDEEMETIKLAEGIFGHLDAKTLSDLNHQQYSWRKSYENSKDPHTPYYHKELSVIEQIDEEDLNRIKYVVLSHIDSGDEEEVFEIVNGKTFYYNPSAVTLNEEVMKILQNFHGEDDVYSIYHDEGNGYVIY